MVECQLFFCGGEWCCASFFLFLHSSMSLFLMALVKFCFFFFMICRCQQSPSHSSFLLESVVARTLPAILSSFGQWCHLWTSICFCTCASCSCWCVLSVHGLLLCNSFNEVCVLSLSLLACGLQVIPFLLCHPFFCPPFHLLAPLPSLKNCFSVLAAARTKNKGHWCSGIFGKRQ